MSATLLHLICTELFGAELFGPELAQAQQESSSSRTSEDASQAARLTFDRGVSRLEVARSLRGTDRQESMRLALLSAIDFRDSDRVFPSRSALYNLMVALALAELASEARDAYWLFEQRYPSDQDFASRRADLRLELEERFHLNFERIIESVPAETPCAHPVVPRENLDVQYSDEPSSLVVRDELNRELRLEVQSPCLDYDLWSVHLSSLRWSVPSGVTLELERMPMLGGSGVLELMAGPSMTPLHIQIGEGLHRLNEERRLEGGRQYELSYAAGQSRVDLDVPRWLVSGLALSTAIFAGVVSGLALDSKARYDTSPSPNRLSETRDWNAAADGLWIGAAALTIGAGVLWILPSGDVPGELHWSASPLIDRPLEATEGAP